MHLLVIEQSSQMCRSHGMPCNQHRHLQAFGLIQLAAEVLYDTCELARRVSWPCTCG